MGLAAGGQVLGVGGEGVGPAAPPLLDIMPLSNHWNLSARPTLGKFQLGLCSLPPGFKSWAATHELWDTGKLLQCLVPLGLFC